MSNKGDINKAKISRIFPEEYLESYSEDLKEIYNRQDKEIEQTKNEIKNNIKLNNGELDFMMSFS